MAFCRPDSLAGEGGVKLVSTAYIYSHDSVGKSFFKTFHWWVWDGIATNVVTFKVEHERVINELWFLNGLNCERVRFSSETSFIIEIDF